MLLQSEVGSDIARRSKTTADAFTRSATLQNIARQLYSNFSENARANMKQAKERRDISAVKLINVLVELVQRISVCNCV